MNFSYSFVLPDVLDSRSYAARMSESFSSCHKDSENLYSSICRQPLEYSLQTWVSCCCFLDSALRNDVASKMARKQARQEQNSRIINICWKKNFHLKRILTISTRNLIVSPGNIEPNFSFTSSSVDFLFAVAFNNELILPFRVSKCSGLTQLNSPRVETFSQSWKKFQQHRFTLEKATHNLIAWELWISSTKNFAMKELLAENATSVVDFSFPKLLWTEKKKI